MNHMIVRMGGIARDADRRVLRVVVAVLVGASILFPAMMTMPRHGPPPRHLSTPQNTAPRSCIEGACQEAARCIQAMVKQVVLRLPATPLLLLVLLLAILPLALPSRERMRLRDWWWPPDRRRAFLQVFLI